MPNRRPSGRKTAAQRAAQRAAEARAAEPLLAAEEVSPRVIEREREALRAVTAELATVDGRKSELLARQTESFFRLYRYGVKNREVAEDAGGISEEAVIGRRKAFLRRQAASE